jgi:uncharacterized membrane protein
MATGSPDPLPRLADALSEVGARLLEISNELRGLSLRPAPAPQPAPEPQPIPMAAWQPLPPPPQPQPWPRLPPYQPPVIPARVTLWERLSRDGAGSRILAWAGGVVTLAGVVLLLVLAVQRDYLGPVPRVLLGAALGLALAGIGLRLHANPAARTGAYALAATGTAVLYLDVIAATTLYRYLPPVAGLVAGLAVAGAGILVATRWAAQPLAMFVVLGCVVSAPVLTGGFVPLLLGFLLVLQIATTPAQLDRMWGGLCLAAGLPPLLATLIGIAEAHDHRFGPGVTSVAVLSLVTSAVQVGSATVNAARRRDADSLPFALLLAAPAPTMLATTLLPRIDAAMLTGALAVLLLLVWVAHRAAALRVSAGFALGAAGVGALVAFQTTATAFTGNARTIALLAEGLLLALVAVRLRYPAALLAAGLFGLAGLALTLATAATPRLLTVAPPHELARGPVATAGLTTLLLAVLAIVLCWAATRLERLPGPDRAPLGWVAAGLTALYGSTGAPLSVGLAVSPDRTGFLFGHVLVTVSWTVGALGLLVRGIDVVPLRVAGLALVGAALLKLVLFDLSSLDGIARVAAFLVAGLVLLAAGTRYAKLVASRRRTIREAGSL